MPSAMRHAGPPLDRTAHIARSAPFGSCDGLATQPKRFGADPRTNTTIDPSSDNCTSVRSVPSSCMKFVKRTGVNSGATAVYTFRKPRSYAIHATRSTFFADVSINGDAGDKNCATVAFGCAASGIARRRAMVAQAERCVRSKCFIGVSWKAVCKTYDLWARFAVFAETQ